jgi:L-amino acid N-acyltransferase YncA
MATATGQAQVRPGTQVNAAAVPAYSCHRTLTPTNSVVEHSVYVDRDANHRGIGHMPLSALIAPTEEAGIWTVQSGIPNSCTSRCG